jgi:hypothetical protein
LAVALIHHKATKGTKKSGRVSLRVLRGFVVVLLDQKKVRIAPVTL